MDIMDKGAIHVLGRMAWDFIIVLLMTTNLKMYESFLSRIFHVVFSNTIGDG